MDGQSFSQILLKSVDILERTDITVAKPETCCFGNYSFTFIFTSFFSLKFYQLIEHTTDTSTCVLNSGLSFQLF